MHEKIMTLNQVQTTPGLWVDVTRNNDIFPPGMRRYLEIINSCIGVTLLHRKTFPILEIIERASKPLMITRGSRYYNRPPREVVAYLIPTEFTAEDLHRLKDKHKKLMGRDFAGGKLIDKLDISPNEMELQRESGENQY